MPLVEYTDEEPAHLFPTPWVQNMDRGPFEARHVAFRNLNKGQWVMLKENAWLRERAYVF